MTSTRPEPACRSSACDSPASPSEKDTRPGERGCSPRNQSRAVLRRSALPTTLTDDSAMAAAAMIGDSRIPKNG